MVTTVQDRLIHIKDAIAVIKTILSGQSIEFVAGDLIIRAAFERYLEIVSEASRHLPAEMKVKYGPKISWQKVADLGNVLRHTYQHSNLRALWTIYTDDLDDLAAAIDDMIAGLNATPPTPWRS